MYALRTLLHRVVIEQNADVSRPCCLWIASLTSHCLNWGLQSLTTCTETTGARDLSIGGLYLDQPFSSNQRSPTFTALLLSTTRSALCLETCSDILSSREFLRLTFAAWVKFTASMDQGVVRLGHRSNAPQKLDGSMDYAETLHGHQFSVNKLMVDA